MTRRGERRGISRRTLLVGGGAAAGLAVAWAIWPRDYQPNLRAAPGETLFNAFLKIGNDGRVVVAVPQAEMGQGVYTSLPQILADELGSDWRTVAVEHAPLGPLYANDLLLEGAGKGLPSALQGIGGWAARQFNDRTALMITGGSTSIRAFETRMREAGAAARALLMKAAAERWNVEWDSLDAAGGFVLNGDQRIGFGELAADAAGQPLPDDLPVRGGVDNRLVGQPLPRLDVPSKLDGSAQFGGDVRLRDMVYASVRSGPRANSRLLRMDRPAAEAVPGVLRLVEQGNWVAAVAANWWAANRAVEELKPVFETAGLLADDIDIEASFNAAMEGTEGRSIYSQGDVGTLLAEGQALRADYSVGFAPNAALEPLTATARMSGDKLEIWAPTQAPALARAAAARAAGMVEGQVTLYPTMIGGGYGRKIETAAIEQSAFLAKELRRPVQLTWSRLEEILQDSYRPAARGRYAARLGEAGRIMAWQARIAAPDAASEVATRLGGSAGLAGGMPAVDGAVPPYGIDAIAIDHVSMDAAVRSGLWRSGAHSFTAFFTESFIDELARQAQMEPLSFRMQMLGGNPRLARVLSTAAALGGWDGGGAGSAMGIAACSAYGSHIAMLAEVEVDAAQQIRLLRAVCAVDCGRVINPAIVQQMIEGGIIHGMATASGRGIGFEAGLPDVRNIAELELPRLADTPEIAVEILESEENPGGVTELAVPVVAPAMANAAYAATGRRLRTLPLVLGIAS
jgi:isoquinoline 1-oxidoreductase subunit beta